MATRTEDILSGVKPSCLLALRTTRLAGAERIAVELSNGLENLFCIEIATIVHQVGSLPVERPRRGIFSILFRKYDVIHSHLFLPGVLIRLRRIYDRSFVWVHTVHYCTYDGQKWARTKNFLDQHWIFPKVDSLVAVSTPTLDWIRRYPNATLVENGLELVDRTGPFLSRSFLTIGCTAMLRSEKGVSDLVRAFAQFIQKNPGAQLRVAGDGPEKENLRELTKELGLERCIQFMGFIDDMDTFLRSIDIYVNPSVMESFGIATLEAMQYSLPMVATDVGSNPGILGYGEFGVIVPRTPDLAHDLSAALGRVAEDLPSWRARSHRGFEFHRDNKKTTQMINNYAGIYHSLLKTRENAGADVSAKSGATPAGVCIISPVITHSTGGLQKQILLQSRELAALGYRILLLQRYDRKIKNDPSGEWSHVQFISTPNPWPEWGKDSVLGLRLRGMLFLVCGMWQLARHRPLFQVLHAHQLYSPTLIGVAAKILFRKKLVVKVTASGFLGELRELRRLPFFALRKRAFRYIDKLIVLSDEMRLEMRELGFSPSRIEVLSNGVTIPRKVHTPRAIDPSAPVFRVLYCGRLSSEKCLGDLVRAAEILAQRGVEIRVDLVGGTYGGRDVTTELKARAANLPAMAEVVFHGNQKNVEPFYLSADAFVLPSVSEGMSNALLEALAYGIPCVVSDIAPNRSLVENGINGLLFKQGDAADLARQLEVIAQDRKNGGRLAERLGTTSREQIKGNFSTFVIGKKLASIYSTLSGVKVDA